MDRPEVSGEGESGPYARLRKYSLSDDVLYGPFATRRTGLSLGVNLLPAGAKVCSFNCVYCQCGWSTIRPAQVGAMGLSYPSVEEVAERTAAGFARLREQGIVPDTITLSGNGEPTLHPQFDLAVEAVVRNRDRFLAGARVNVLSDGTELHRPEVVRGLNRLDERHMKLDAGDAEGLRRVNLPLVSFDLETYVMQLGALKDCFVQAFFCRGRIDNTGDGAVASWLGLIRRIGPVRVDLMSLDRVPAAEGLEPAGPELLEGIARRVRDLGVAARVY